METRAWIHSLVSVAISGGASGVTLCIVDPSQFNLSPQGIKHLATVCLLTAGLGVANLLKSSPLPIAAVTESTTTTVTAIKSGE